MESKRLIKVEMSDKEYELYQEYCSDETTLRTRMIWYIIFVIIQVAISFGYSYYSGNTKGPDASTQNIEEIESNTIQDEGGDLSNDPQIQQQEENSSSSNIEEKQETQPEEENTEQTEQIEQSANKAPEVNSTQEVSLDNLIKVTKQKSE